VTKKTKRPTSYLPTQSFAPSAMTQTNMTMAESVSGIANQIQAQLNAHGRPARTPASTVRSPNFLNPATTEPEPIRRSEREEIPKKATAT